MKRKRFSVEQIVAVLKQAELGMPVADLIPSGDRRADLLPLKEAVWRFAVRSGPRVQAAAGRERSAEEPSGRTESGQGDTAGHQFKQMARKRQAVKYIVHHYSVARRRACRIVKRRGQDSDRPVEL
jgi:putative transposase